MHNAQCNTAPAYKVRELERNRTLRRIENEISEEIARYPGGSLYQIVIIQLLDYLTSGGKMRKFALPLCGQIVNAVRQFQRSEEEGLWLVGKLAEWTTTEMVRQLHSALEQQERDNPTLIFRVANPTDEVEFT